MASGTRSDPLPATFEKEPLLRLTVDVDLRQLTFSLQITETKLLFFQAKVAFSSDLFCSHGLLGMRWEAADNTGEGLLRAFYESGAARPVRRGLVQTTQQCRRVPVLQPRE